MSETPDRIDSIPYADRGHLEQTENGPIPFSMPDLGPDEIDAARRVISSGWVTSGPEMLAFEREFSDFVGGGVQAVATNSATAGLHLALEACGVGPGDEVIIPTWTFTATAEVVRYLGATPVLVDVDPRTLNLDVSTIEKALTARTKAAVPVHMAGLSVHMPPIAELLWERGISIIEDAAHALPTVTNGRTVGSTQWSDAAVFSFYANKTITTGEGGMITTRDQELADRARIMRLHGIDRDVFRRYSADSPGWRYDVVAPGYKYNMPDIAAALGRVQLKRAMTLRAQRESIADRYFAGLSDLPLRLPTIASPGDSHAWHLYIVQIDASANMDRDSFIDAMARRGITCSVHFIPLHHHSYWRNSVNPQVGGFPFADRVFPQVVSLPIYSGMSDLNVDRVIDAVRDILTL